MLLIGMLSSNNIWAPNFFDTSQSSFSDTLLLSATHLDRLSLLFTIFFVFHLISIITFLAFKHQDFIFASSNHLNMIVTPIGFLEVAKTDSYLAYVSWFDGSLLIYELYFIMILVKSGKMKLAYDML